MPPRRTGGADAARSSGSVCIAARPRDHRNPAERRGAGALEPEQMRRPALVLPGIVPPRLLPRCPSRIVEDHSVLDHLDACDEVHGGLGLDEVADVSILRWQRPP